MTTPASELSSYIGPTSPSTADQRSPPADTSPQTWASITPEWIVTQWLGLFGRGTRVFEPDHPRRQDSTHDAGDHQVAEAGLAGSRGE